ncbi:MAG: spore cortex biosynthesis protein YabQ [Oscillospiraceae bacterium]
MGISLTQQTTTFLISCFIGVLFGAFYDIFRISRIAFKQPVWLLFIEDLIYFLHLCYIRIWVK